MPSASLMDGLNKMPGAVKRIQSKPPAHARYLRGPKGTY